MSALLGWEEASPEAWADLLAVPRLELHAELDSTNDRLLELAREGAEPFTTVVAGAQRRGRGRGDKGWLSPAGSGLWISVLLPAAGEGKPGVASLAVGVAAALAIEASAGVEIELKWPNDLYLAQGKVGGVLCELVIRSGGSSGGEEARDSVIVAGIGINLRRPSGSEPGDELSSAGYLEEWAEERVPAPRVARALVRQLRRWADPPPLFLDGELRREWERRDLLAGRSVAVEVGPVGSAAGVARDGSLRVVAADGGLHSVNAGSVRIRDNPSDLGG